MLEKCKCGRYINAVINGDVVERFCIACEPERFGAILNENLVRCLKAQGKVREATAEDVDEVIH